MKLSDNFRQFEVLPDVPPVVLFDFCLGVHLEVLTSWDSTWHTDIWHTSREFDVSLLLYKSSLMIISVKVSELIYMIATKKSSKFDPFSTFVLQLGLPLHQLLFCCHLWTVIKTFDFFLVTYILYRFNSNM